MRVLVILPTHNRNNFWPLALESIERQTVKAHKIVITGNVGPGEITDDLLYQRLNRAISESDCDAFTILSDDDLLESNFIERMAGEMEARDVHITYSDCWMFGDMERRGDALGEWTEENINRNTVPLVTSLCSVQAWWRAGGYDGVPLFDWWFWWKCYYSGATAHWLREPLWRYRRHGNQESKAANLAADRAFLLAKMEEMRPRFAGAKYPFNPEALLSPMPPGVPQSDPEPSESREGR